MKKVALINDLSGFGKCSLTAAIPVISVLGLQACPLPTAVLSAQTGFDSYYCDDFTDRMDLITNEWNKMQVVFDGIYSGYLADAKQIEKVLHFLEVFQKENTFYLVDPVLGDCGEKYDVFSNELLEGMKALVQRADVITPNLTELCLLADVAYEEIVRYSQKEDYLWRIEELCETVFSKVSKNQTIIVTGIVRKKNAQNYVGNLAVSEKESFHIETPYTGKGFSGTGDLFASVICGCLVKGLSIREAMEKATYFLQEAIEEASRENIPPTHGIYFEKYLSRLL